MRLSDRERVAAQVPEEAAEVLGSRSTHGEAYKNHKQIADFWSTYLGVQIDPHEVAQMMVLMKVSRQSLGSIERDHYTDQAGYSGIGWACEAYDYLQENGELPDLSSIDADRRQVWRQVADSCDTEAGDLGGHGPDTEEDPGSQVPENARTCRVDDPGAPGSTVHEPVEDTDQPTGGPDVPEATVGDVGGTNDDTPVVADGMTEKQLLRRVARPLASLTNEHIEVEGVRSMSGDEHAFGDDVEVTILEPKPVEDLAAAMRYAEIEHLALSEPEEIDFDLGVIHCPIGEAWWHTKIGAPATEVHQFSAKCQVGAVMKRETNYVDREDL